MVDLSSDTQTRPVTAMRAAIARAEVGDEQKGEDPTVNALQERVDGLLGMEAAVFLSPRTSRTCPSGHTRPPARFAVCSTDTSRERGR